MRTPASGAGPGGCYGDRAMDVELWVMRLTGAEARAAARQGIDGSGECEWSFSDSGDLAVLAVSRAGPLGADVEQLRERHSIERVARRALGPAARDAIAAAPARRRLERFYRC